MLDSSLKLLLVGDHAILTSCWRTSGCLAALDSRWCANCASPALQCGSFFSPLAPRVIHPW